MGAENIRLGRLVPGNPDEMIVPTRQIFAMVDELETLREKVKPVNAAAMREALEDSQSLLESFSRGEYGSQVREQMRDNRAALAAPARNIDAIPEDELVRAFKRDNCDQYENSSEDPRTCCEGRCVECIVKWMIKQHETD